MKPRLLFVSNLFPDGAEPYRGLDNAMALRHMGAAVDIRVISPRPWLPFVHRPRQWRPCPADAAFQPVYVRAPYLPKAGGWVNHHWMAAALARPLRRLRVEFPWDAVLCSWLFPDACAVVAACSRVSPEAPVTLVAQGSDVHAYLRMPRRRRAILAAAARARGIITRSRSLATALAEAGADRRILHPVHNGVDTALFHPADPAEAKRAHGLPADCKVLLFVGNFLPVKDPLRLVALFQTLRQRAADRMDLRLVMIGKGPLEGEVDARVTAAGLEEVVVRTGPQDAAAVGRWMRAADLLCLTSRNEGLPNVVLEAQASALPVLATDVGGIHEVVDTPWRGGLAPLDDDPAWLAEAERLLNQDPQARQLLIGQPTVRSWPQTAAEYQRLIFPQSKHPPL